MKLLWALVPASLLGGAIINSVEDSPFLELIAVLSFQVVIALILWRATVLERQKEDRRLAVRGQTDEGLKEDAEK